MLITMVAIARAKKMIDTAPPRKVRGKRVGSVREKRPNWSHPTTKSYLMGVLSVAPKRDAKKNIDFARFLQDILESRAKNARGSLRIHRSLMNGHFHHKLSQDLETDGVICEEFSVVFARNRPRHR